MKIIELSMSLTSGGAERFIIDISNQFAKDQSNEITLCTVYDDSVGNNGFYKNEIGSSVNYINCGLKRSILGKLLAIIKILLIIKQLKPDVVHAHLEALNYIIVPSLLFRKIKFFHTVHNLADKDISSETDKKIKKYLYNKSISAIAISDVCADSFTSCFGYKPASTINNGCRMINVTPELESARSEIENLKPNKKTKVLINVARIAPAKNHVMLVEAFNQIIADGVDAILIVIGDTQYSPEIMKSVDAINNSGRAHFIGRRHNVIDYMHCSDLFCMPSLWEGLPIALLEAGLSGLYSACTPAGGIKDVILDDSIGAMTTNFSLESYVKVLHKSLSHNVNNKSIMSYYINNFSMKKCADDYIDVFMCENTSN